MIQKITEPEFAQKIQELRDLVPDDVGWVTGPGRSGAIASVYASHLLGIPFVPYGSKCPDRGRVLIVDTACQSGRTLRKAAKKYEAFDPFIWFGFHEPPRVIFWYEPGLPHRHRHERPLSGVHLIET